MTEKWWGMDLIATDGCKCRKSSILYFRRITLNHIAFRLEFNIRNNVVMILYGYMLYAYVGVFLGGRPQFRLFAPSVSLDFVSFGWALG